MHADKPRRQAYRWRPHEDIPKMKQWQNEWDLTQVPSQRIMAINKKEMIIMMIKMMHEVGPWQRTGIHVTQELIWIPLASNGSKHISSINRVLG